MLLSSRGRAHVEAMGRRAGETFRDLGIPSRNPFHGSALRELARAFDRAYFTAARPRPLGA